MIDDRSYNSEKIQEVIIKKQSHPVISRKRNSRKGNSDIDWCLYKYRHLVENTVARMKDYRDIDKLAKDYIGIVALAR
nr:hypothetical protein [Gilliamella mensalis]